MGKSTILSGLKSYLTGSLEGGIEFGSNCIKIVKYSQGCNQIEKMQRVPFSQEVYKQGAILDEEEFISVLAPVVKSMGLVLHDVALVLPDTIFIISNLIIFKTESEEEKLELIRSELEEKVYNFDASLYEIKYLDIADVESKKEEVQAFALSIEMKEHYVTLLEKLKLFPIMVTPTVYPLSLVLLQQKVLIGLPLYKSGVLVNLGGGNTKILIEVGRECKYYRTAALGSNEGNTLIQEYLSVNSEVAEVVKREFDLMVDLPATNSYYGVFTDFKHLIQDNFEQIESIIEIYEKNNSKQFIDWVIITGGVVEQKGILEFLSQIALRQGRNYKIIKADYSKKFSSKLKNSDEFILYDSLVGFLKE
ncbi:MAG: pilus assembly protein PilM [Fusobacteria bacterium]|nr:pilus assembly protein PilM [Fusobacteriota bacterium]